MKRINFNDYSVLDELPSVKLSPLTQEELNRYAKASGDSNPIHLNEEFAKSVGLKGTIAHGMYLMAQLGKFWSNRIHPLQVEGFHVKFKNMTYLGETLVLSGFVKRKREEDGLRLIVIEVQACNESGEVKALGEVKVKCD